LLYFLAMSSTREWNRSLKLGLSEVRRLQGFFDSEISLIDDFLDMKSEWESASTDAPLDQTQDIIGNNEEIRGTFPLSSRLSSTSVAENHWIQGERSAGSALYADESNSDSDTWKKLGRGSTIELDEDRRTEPSRDSRSVPDINSRTETTKPFSETTLGVCLFFSNPLFTFTLGDLFYFQLRIELLLTLL
jgi:hypothetical protein